ncbi:MAG: hypothetical protein BroJett040_04070 [Oligoflexia bacterium]|nr:MAG: hypothetical protein BroJett040_04070 [Oligoflexia bacterium]
MSAAPVLVKTRKFSLEVSQGSLKGEKFHFTKPIVQIGRGPENDIVLDKDVKVSRIHAEIRQQNGQVFIYNVSQKNTVIVNGQKITQLAIEGDCKILIGDSEFLFSVEPAPKPQLTGFPAQRPGQVPISQTAPVAPIAVVPSTSSIPTPYQQVSHHPQAYVHQPPPPPPPQAHQHAGYAQPAANPSRGMNPRLRFYLIVGVVLAIAAWLLSPSGKKKKPIDDIRSQVEIEEDLAKSEKAIAEINKQSEKRQEGSIQFMTAQQHYVKGFRDYSQGQYGRAMQSFQASLAFYPQHDLAKRYYSLAKKKNDELIKFNMSQGTKYRSKNNYRLCASSFRSVLVLNHDPNDPLYKEAKQYMEECERLGQGKY